MRLRFIGKRVTDSNSSFIRYLVVVVGPLRILTFDRTRLAPTAAHASNADTTETAHVFAAEIALARAIALDPVMRRPFLRRHIKTMT